MRFGDGCDVPIRMFLLTWRGSYGILIGPARPVLIFERLEFANYCQDRQIVCAKFIGTRDKRQPQTPKGKHINVLRCPVLVPICPGGGTGMFAGAWR